MPNRILHTLLFLLLVMSAAQAYEVGGIELPDTASPLDSVQLLYLNGAGIREKFFLDIYVGALYLPARTTNADAILADDRAASVHMYILHSEISKQKIINGWQDGLRANLDDAGFSAIRPELEAFNELFTTVHEGDVIRIDYLPGSGTTVRINDEVRGAVPGNRFFRDLLRVWLGEYPASRSLKRAMLGG